MLLCAITQRALLSENDADRIECLISRAVGWAATGVDFIQIREKDLAPDELAELASRLIRAVRQTGAAAKVLLNAGPEIAAGLALGTGADGVHLPGGLGPRQLAGAIEEIRRTLSDGSPVSVSCHSIAEIRSARAAGATFALFAPVFEKPRPNAQALAGQGLAALAAACRAAHTPAPEARLPVLALGGVKLANAPQCLAAGADGIAGIRLFLNESKGHEWRKL